MKPIIYWLIVFLVFLLSPSPGGWAAAGSAHHEYRTQRNANREPLTSLLEAWMSHFDAYLSYEVSKVEGLRANKPNFNRLSADQALDALLKNTGLVYRKLEANYYVIQAAAAAEQQVNRGQPTPVRHALPQPVLVPAAAERIAFTVTGRVTDIDNEPLIGVNIQVKAQPDIGTVTDVDGSYELEIPQPTDSLVFSYIGFEPQTVGVAGRAVVNVTLSPNIQALEEVVVIGYQTVAKKDLTGATSVIDPNAANRVIASNLAQSIQGLAPGVTVRNSGRPGEGAAIEIRGVASFLQTSPLYVIDGMIADANSTINTNDIASIQILKDASAAAIYGSRAANGVIIITTKQGEEGPARVSFSARYGTQEIPNRWDVMNAAEYAALKRQAYINSGQQPAPSVAEGTFNPNIDTDWQEEVLRTGSEQDYNLSISGGSRTVNFLASGSYYDNVGVLEGHSFDRASLRINTNVTKGRFTFGENAVFTNTNVKVPARGNAFYDMPQLLPVIPVRSDDYISETNPEGWGIGSLEAISYAWNPLAINAINRNTNNFAKVVGNAFAQYEILKGLRYRFNAGLEVSFDHNSTIRENGVWAFTQNPEASSLAEDRQQFTNVLLEHTLNFDQAFGRHTINGVGGYSQQEVQREVTGAQRTGLQEFNGNYLGTINSALGEPGAFGGIPEHYRIQGILGRVNYNFDDRYLLTLTGRYDQDSRFGEDYRNGFFPSVAVGWRLSKEQFFNVDWISDLKLTASYGELGIVTVGSWDVIGVLNNAPRAIFGPNQQPYVGVYQARLTNPDLRWERRIIKNIGLSTSLFENRFTFSAEVYNSLSEDALINLVLPSYLGNQGGNPPVNATSIRNTGVELAATYRQRERAFQWDISANLTTIKNTVEDVGNQGAGINYLQTGITRSQIGRSIGEWFVIRTDGLFQSDEEVRAHTNSQGQVIQPLAKPGDVRFVDINDDGQINAADRTFVGSPWPTLQSGAQFNAYYGQFNLNVQLVGVFGYKVFNDVRRLLDTYQNTNFRGDVRPWTPENPNTDDPRIGISTNDPGLIDNGRFESDRWLENASYVRLRNVELGYNLPASLTDRIRFTNARLFLSAQNLVTFTEYSGLDPDVTGNGILERGMDNGNWPSSRVFTFGVQGTF